jgi:beta-lactamase family protein
LSDQSGAAAPHDSRDLPDRLSLRHSKLEAKRRLAAGEFTTLHDAQLAVAREHGISSWAALKEHIAAEAERSRALAQVRWLFGRYAAADAPGWTAPGRDELSEHCTEHLLAFVPPQAAAALLGGVAPKLREDLVILDADPLYLSAKVADLLVEAVVEPQAPHRLIVLTLSPGGAPGADPRVAQPPTASLGPVPARVPELVGDSYAQLGLVGLVMAGDWDSGPAAEVWACARGWADLEQNVPLGPGHRFPVHAITTLVTSTTVLCLVADGVMALDDPVNRHLRCRAPAACGRPGRTWSASGPAGGRCCPGNSPSKRCARTPGSTAQARRSGSAGCCSARRISPATPGPGPARRPR